jgi:hypothetical protein
MTDHPPDTPASNPTADAGRELAAAVSDLLDMVAIAIGLPEPAAGSEAAYLNLRSERADCVTLFLADVHLDDVNTVHAATRALRTLLDNRRVIYGTAVPDSHGPAESRRVVVAGSPGHVPDPVAPR